MTFPLRSAFSSTFAQIQLAPHTLRVLTLASWDEVRLQWEVDSGACATKSFQYSYGQMELQDGLGLPSRRSVPGTRAICAVSSHDPHSDRIDRDGGKELEARTH